MSGNDSGNAPSARLRLRPHVLSDYPACKALWQHPNTIRFIGGVAQSDQEVWFRLLRYGGMWALLGYGFWVFEDRNTGEVLGEGGLLNARRDIAGLQDIPEVGWALMPQAQGRGLATEAMTTVLDWADGQPRTRFPRHWRTCWYFNAHNLGVQSSA